MATAYELAFLSNFSYTSQTGQSSRAFEIPISKTKDYKPTFIDASHIRSSKQGKYLWAIVNDVGLFNNMYCATFKNLQTNEMVFAFRGTRTNNFVNAAADIAVDAVHLLIRKSPYIEAAKNYLGRHITNNSIITGHSLGGYLAISMAFYFRNNRIASFNAPHVMSGFGEAFDASRTHLQNNFLSNKIVCYNSTKDFASILTKVFGTGGLKMNNIKYVNLPNAGFHGLKPMLDQLQKRKNAINWNAK